MDEFFFHLSQHLESLQLHFTTLLNHGRQLSLTVGGAISNNAGRLWNGQLNEQFKIVTQRSVYLFQTIGRHFSTVFAQPVPILYPGGAGFFTGAAVGILIGMSWRRIPLPMQRMKAVVCMAYDGLDALSCFDDMIVPTITNPCQLVIHVKSASVDVVDIKICYGYGRALRKFLGNGKGDLPVTLGRDCAGVVVDIGPGVKKFEIGDEVWVVSPLWSNGTISELVLASEDMVSKKPRGIGFEGAASLPFSGCLAYSACLKAGILHSSEPGKRVLIHSGVSPVGCIACQLARLHGCEVTVTCSARAAAVARALGAKHVIIYGQMELEAQLQEDRFDVVLNTVGGVSEASCRLLSKTDGVFVSTVLDTMSYDQYSFPMSLLYGIGLRAQFLAKRIAGRGNQWSDVEFSGEVLDKLAELVDQGHVQPVVDKVFLPQDTILALQHCDSVEAIGKTVIRFRSNREVGVFR